MFLFVLQKSTTIWNRTISINNGILFLQQVYKLTKLCNECKVNLANSHPFAFLCLGLILRCNFRLGSKSVLASISRFPATPLSTAKYAQAAVPKITFKKYEAPQDEHHDIRNERLNRPMSPHLTIYEYQLTSILSITHRITGNHSYCLQ